MITDHSRQDDGMRPQRSPLTLAAILLGIYVAMYLAAAGIVHVLALPDAVAGVARESSPTIAATSLVSAHWMETDDSPPAASLDEDTDNSRACRPSAAIDTLCIYD